MDKTINEILALPTVYHGGHHVVKCDGQNHYIIAEDSPPHFDGKCWCKPKEPPTPEPEEIDCPTTKTDLF